MAGRSVPPAVAGRRLCLPPPASHLQLPKTPSSLTIFTAHTVTPMRLLLASLFTGLMLATAFSSASAQGPVEATQTVKATPAMIIYLVDGRRMQVDEVRESAEGFWYTTGTLTTLLDKARVKRIEQPLPPEEKAPLGAEETLAGSWSIKDSHKVEKFFATKFDRRLPTTAFGQSALHTRWGLDHRQGIDVGLHPESEEGRALINFLRAEKIPFLAFRGAIPGVATGPHIHIGRGSHRTPVR